ncbi:MAG: iron-containing alcohol dehydrogenase [Gammaproteobacteria bacterium]|nr:iron-containing alcohol dehydrogenase [Gammaproteobacteria bacterium]
MNKYAFSIAALPELIFAEGSLMQLPELILRYGKQALFVTGSKSFCRSASWKSLQEMLARHNINWQQLSVSGEPSPQLIDEVVNKFRHQHIDVVVGIGGGSVLDASKAIAGLLPFGNSVLDHLEGVGKGIEYHGPALPYIAVPTTAGTGSEATKNAVLSVQGEGGYKKSFRHNSLVAKVALLDPELLQTCTPELIAAQGMDAFTQLMESYVSTRANPYCDALALSGLQAFNQGFWHAWKGGEGEDARAGRAAMHYAAYLSGVTLAQVGLGSVHGLASPLGAFFPIPHGVVCGTLVAVATEVNIRALRTRQPGSLALEKYADIGRLLTAQALTDEEACNTLVELLTQWSETLRLPRLSDYDVGESDIERIVANSRGNSMLTNPLVLTDDEVAEIVRRRL